MTSEPRTNEARREKDKDHDQRNDDEREESGRCSGSKGQVSEEQGLHLKHQLEEIADDPCLEDP